MKRYTFFVFLLGATMTVSATNKNIALGYINHALNLSKTDHCLLLGVNL